MNQWQKYGMYGALCTIALISGLAIGSVLNVPSLFVPAKPDFSYERGELKVELKSVLPPSASVAIEFYIKNNGSIPAHNVLAILTFENGDKSEILRDAELIGTLEPKEIKRVEFGGIIYSSSIAGSNSNNKGYLEIKSDEATRKYVLSSDTTNKQ